jgi:hypothetical protein
LRSDELINLHSSLGAITKSSSCGRRCGSICNLSLDEVVRDGKLEFIISAEMRLCMMAWQSKPLEFEGFKLRDVQWYSNAKKVGGGKGKDGL